KPLAVIYCSGRFDSCPFRITCSARKELHSLSKERGLSMEQSMDDKNSVLRNIPQVEKILQNAELAGHISAIGHSIVVQIIRQEISLFREGVSGGEELKIEDLFSAIVKKCSDKKLEKLQRVINGTGVIIHTNLGRSPINTVILQKLANDLSGYCNLELHLPTEARGKRGGFAEELICALTGAEDALIVNNNASSVFLILTCLARGKEVVVSRGELIQIGGGFRIPDIMAQTGAVLVETGTTNITTLDDFKKAITENTGMIFSAHQSNFRIDGFSSSPTLSELASLKNGNIIAVRDLGSGNLVTDRNLPRPFEPTVSSELSQGMDLVCFSGDKLLGGPQAGIIVGNKNLVSKLRRHPLMRMIRVDKITYFLLQETLLAYLNDRKSDISLWEIALNGKEKADRRALRLMKKVERPDKKMFMKRVPTKCAFGGGALPGVEIDSTGIAINIPGTTPAELYTFFVREPVPIIGAVINDAFTIDLVTVLDKDITDLAQSISACIKHFNG
ncbi:MAG TPA: L-seryl-tRNA(Sec) selenium transferase, partial [Spirochaetota bacterium]|nr:L-seryl-tRNA(Sec) selenium transferase [Spirochaetota bacterium]